MTAQYVQVNIGREDLTSDDWIDFQNGVYLAIRKSIRGESTANIEQHEGSGWWDGSEPEDSLHLSIVADVDLYTLRVKLTELKTRFNQDAIALIAGSDLT